MLRRLLLVVSILVPLLVLAFAGYAWWAIRAAQPVYSGELALNGLAAPVRVRYGPHGVPSIEAGSAGDLMLAQGFVVARERFWQMDLMRRLAQGRLSEIFGADALTADRLFRTLGLGEDARRALADLEPGERALLEAHARGVNAYLDQARNRLPIEYRILRTDPAPWHPADSLAIGAYLAWTQSFNLRSELTFLRLAARIGGAKARLLFPLDEGIPAPPLPSGLPADLGALMPAFPAALLSAIELPARLGLAVPGAASNAWAVTGPRTTDGAALLANDPHLAPSVPGIWYELEIRAPGLHAAGLVLPGVPLVLIGHNADLAWGFTSAIADTQDLFLERASDDARSVQRPGGGAEPIETRVEHILVKGADPVDLPVRTTSNGVLLSALLAAPAWRDPGAPPADPMAIPAAASPYLLALRRTNDLPDRAFPALLALNRARTLDEARGAILGFRHVVQNLILAHRDGGIAWQVSGQLPLRGEGSGAFPMPGWVEGHAWRGLASQERNPTLTSPAGGAIVTANNRTVPADFPLRISNAWMAPYRAQRITERLAAAGPLTPVTMAGIQTDRLSIQARHAQAALRALEPRIRRLDPLAWAAAERLLDWDLEMVEYSRAAALFALLEPALYRALYADELGDDLDLLMAISIVHYNPLQETLRSGESAFWDNVTTPRIEGPAEIWVEALRAADAELNARLPAPEEQRLGRLRTLTFPHAFHGVAMLRRVFDVGPIGIGGALDTVNVAKASALDPTRAAFVPSARMIQTPSDWSGTRGTLPLGQSGHLLSPYRSDQLSDWLDGRTHPWPWGGPPDARLIGELVLRPAGPGS